MGDTRQAVNTWTGRIPIGMSVAAIALLVFAFLTGWGKGPPGDEGAAAHLWQLLIGLQAPLILAYLATANWRQPLRIALVFGLQILALIVALAPVAILKL